MSVVGDNIANVNTPGYSRKRAIFKSSEPEIRSFGPLGRGINPERIQSIRDRFLEGRLITELQIQGQLEGQRFTLEQLEQIFFASEESGITEQLSRFFNSFSELSADASSIAKRGAVIGEAQKLANAISSPSTQIKQLRTGNRLQIRDAADRINSILGRIGKINTQLSALEVQGLDTGALGDERQQLISELAQETGVLTYTSEIGQQVVTTSKGRDFVLGDQPAKLEVVENNSGLTVTLDGVDITSELTMGKVGGFLTLENQTLPDRLADLDALAEALATEVNLVHRTGEGLDGSTGLDFFTFSATDPAGTLTVAITDEMSVGAAQPGSGPGDGTVARLIADLRDQTIPSLGDQSFGAYFSGLVFELGLEARQNGSSLSAQSTIVHQLRSHRDSVSAVSLDEEAANLLLLERAYQASARFIQTVDELLDETMALIR